MSYRAQGGVEALVGHLTALPTTNNTGIASDLRLTGPTELMVDAKLNALGGLIAQQGVALGDLGNRLGRVSEAQIEQGEQLGDLGNQLGRLSEAQIEQGERLGETADQIQALQDVVLASAPQAPTLSCRNDVASVQICGAGGACSTQRYPCSPYACDAAGVTCRDTCNVVGTCAAGSVCDGDGRCVYQGYTCTSLFDLRHPNGNVEPCNGFRCVAGACQQQCVADNQCDMDESYRCRGNLCVKVAAP